MNKPSPIVLPARQEIFFGLCLGVARGVLAIVASILLARTLSVTEFGEFASGINLTVIVLMFASLGMERLTMQVFRRAQRSGDFEAARGLRRIGPMMIIGTCLACIVLLVPAHIFFQDDPFHEHMNFALVLALLPLLALSRFFVGSAAAHGRYLLGNSVHSLAPFIIIILLTLLVTALGWEELDVIHAVVIYGLAYGAVLLALYRIRQVAEPEEFRRGSHRLESMDWLRAGTLFSLAMFCMTVLDRGGVVAVSWLEDDDTGAAFLGAAGELAGFMLFLAMGASAIFSPIMTDAVNDKNTVALRKINFAWFRWVGGTAVVIGVLQLLYATQLLDFYGEEYEVATNAFIIYLVGFAISAFLFLPMMASQYLVGLGQSVLILGGWVVAGLIGMAYLGSHLGIQGVAIAQIGATIGANLGCILAGHRVVAKWKPEHSGGKATYK